MFMIFVQTDKERGHFDLVLDKIPKCKIVYFSN